jgi:hypothetical protein
MLSKRGRTLNRSLIQVYVAPGGTLYFVGSVFGGGNHTDKVLHLPAPSFRICAHTHWRSIDGKCQDHRDILKSHVNLPRPEMKHVCLWPPSVNELIDGSRFHVRRQPAQKLHEWEYLRLDEWGISLLIWKLCARHPVVP